LQLEAAWAGAIGQEHAEWTRPGALRRGVLEVIVGNAVLMQELAHYHKKRLLEELRQRLPSVAISDIRFRAGKVEGKVQGSP
jgi:hypothetical protein